MSDYVSGRNYRRREAALAWLLISPALIIFTVFGFYPFLRNFDLVLYQSGTSSFVPQKFVGLSQLWYVLTSSTFLQSIQATAIYVAIVAPLGVLGGLCLAMLAHQKLRGLSIYRTAFASTVTSSLAVGAAVFGLLLNPAYGFLPWFHISITPPVVLSPTWALPAMALISVWQFSGVSFIILIAGMQSLPDEVLEAASIDGASSWRRMWRITIPLMSSSIFVTFLVGIVGALQGFGQIDVLIGTGNTLITHTDVLVYLVYQAVTSYNNTGLAASYSLALFVITLIVTIFQLRLWQKRRAGVA